MLAAGGIVAAASTLLAYWTSPAVVAGIFVGAVGLWIALHFRIGVLVLLLLSLPLGRLTLAELGPVPVSPVTALVGVLVMVWLWQSLVEKDEIKFSWMQLPLIVFLLVGVVGLYGALDTGVAARTLIVFAMGATVYVVTSQMIRSPEEMRKVVWAVAVATAAMGLYAVATGLGESGVQSYSGQQSEVRTEGLFTHPNQLGGFLALAIPPVAALAVSEAVLWRRALGYLLFAAALLGLVLTYSRGAWIGTSVGLLVLVLMLRKGSWLLPGAILAGAFTSGAILERLRSISTAGSDPAVTNRFEIMETALRLITEHPFFGVGLGNFPAAYGSLMVSNLPMLSYSLEVPPHAHNLLVNLAVEVGLVGLLAFVAMLAAATLKALRAYRTGEPRTRALALGIAAGLGATMIHNLVDVTVYQGFTAILFFAYLGMLDATDRFSGGRAN